MQGELTIGANASPAETPTAGSAKRDPWQRLDRELAAWQAAGRSASLWWRDDDTVAPSATLDRLLQLTDNRDIPLALAVIPSGADNDLARHLDAARVFVLQHGWSHTNHAPADRKKAELGSDRPLDTRLAELARGRQRLGDLFGERALPVLVPPWNRIGADLPEHLPDLGLRGLSCYGPRSAARQGVLALANCHVDILRWRPTRGFLGVEPCLNALTGHLAARRQGSADIAEVTGLLTHHLVHDSAAWTFLEDLLDFLSGRTEVHFLDAHRVFEVQGRPPRTVTAS